MRTLLLAIALAFTTPAAGEVYTWVDNKGVTHFAQRPRADGQSERVEVKPINAVQRVTVEPPDGGVKRDIVMYTTVWCPYCEKARQYLRAENIPFTEYDVETNAKGKRDYAALGASGVPIILIDGERMNGFSRERFDQVYRK